MCCVQWTVILGWCLCLSSLCYALSISRCQSGYINVDLESSNNEITYTGIPADKIVEWDFVSGEITSTVICNTSGSCSLHLFSTTTRSSVSSSLRLKFDVKMLRKVYGAMTVTCKTKQTLQGSPTIASTSCNLDVIHRAEVTSCTAQFNRPIGSQWTVSGSCDVSKAFSQRGRYSCQWTESRQGTYVDITSTVSVADGATEDGITYKSMTCSFTKPFPSQTGNYNYAVVISPGAVRPSVTFDGSSQIELPSVPTTTCPTDYVREGDDVDCTCSVSYHGNPSGSVAWKDKQGSRLVLNGVDRTDNGNVYTCEIKWGLKVVRVTTFILQVAYGPDTVSTNGPKQPVDTDGTKDVTFTCTASGYRPAVSYQWRRLPTASTRNGPLYTVQDVSQNDDGTVLQCTAYNTKFPSVRAVSNVTLNVNYPPSDPPVIRSSSGSSFVLKGDPLTLTCVVRGGKPMSSISVTFNCPNKLDTDDVIGTTEVTSSVTFDSVTANDRGLVCTCSARWKSYDWYSLQTSFTLNDRYTAEVEVLTVNSQSSTVTINETDTLSLDCISSGRPTPRTVLLKDGTEITSEPGGEATVSDTTVVNVTTTASCESAGKYTCQANNYLGKLDHQAINVFVNCAPRFSDGEAAPTYVNFIGKPVTVSFPVTAYPAPTTFTLMLSAGNAGGEEPGIFSDVPYSIYCAQSDKPAAVTLCVLTVNNANLTDRGIYSLSLKNQWGEAIFRFQLDVNVMAAKGNEGKPDGLSSSSAVGVTFGVMAAIFCGLLLWMWRRKWVLPCARQTEGEHRDSNHLGTASHDPVSDHIHQSVSNVPDVDSGHSTECVEGSNPYTGLNLRDIGLRSEYSGITYYVNAAATATDAADAVYENKPESSGHIYRNL